MKILGFLFLIFPPICWSVSDLEIPPKKAEEKSFAIIKDYYNGAWQSKKKGIKYFYYEDVPIELKKYVAPDGRIIEEEKFLGPLLGYNKKGIYFKDKLVCGWETFEKNKKKYKKSHCKDGFPIEVVEATEEERKAGSDRFLIKLELVDLIRQYGMVIKHNNQYERIPYIRSLKGLTVGKNVERAIAKRFMADNPEFTALLNELIKCFTQDVFCMSSNELEEKYLIDAVSFNQRIDPKKMTEAYSEGDWFHKQIRGFFDILAMDPTEHMIFPESSSEPEFMIYTGPIPFVCDYHFISFNLDQKYENQKLVSSKWKLGEFMLRSYYDSMPSTMGCK